ncbi:hypothetical protein GQ44DRAFT_637548 [Phaeosphaeriaceae sp. PMI808]|nr:hypothetical protein GQ44DRAFT_637548 [Phaeosphaeriaceae sp. PMI808]
MAARKKGPVFRVTGLPASQPDDALNATLKATIEDNLSEEEKSKLRVDTVIVPSCYDNEQERVALVEFHGGVPDFLSELVADPLADWQVEMGDIDISFDCHFFGFTQLYAPKLDAPVAADVIAITGLDGHAYGSWRGKGNLGRMWLRDFLSKDLPCCRTMTYGYNSKLASHGVDTIMDYGRELIEELKKVRNTEECLVKAVQTNEDDHPTIASLHKATYGMLLFGIPHKGLVVDDIQKMLCGEDNHPRNALLEQIRAKSDLLAFQLADFKNLIRDRKVVSFYETGQTRRLEFDSESKRWKRTGDFVTAVDADSALLQLPDSMEEKIPLHADHSQVVKFNARNDQGYRSAIDKLKQFERDAPSMVAARFLRAFNRPKACSMVPFQRDSAFVGREDILAEIEKKFEQTALQDHSRVALVGLGGVGKSQIAIEYAYRMRESTPQTWVFWVYSSNATRFEQAYRDIATRVEIPGWDDPKADILRLVYNWLGDERNGRWLMIVDNADDDRVFSSPRAGGAAGLASFLPQVSNGWILVTSRDLLAAMNIVGTRHNVIRIEPMVEGDALALLKTKVSVDKPSEGDAKALVQALEGIPLAVTHAAAYIAVSETVTISRYLDLFRKSEQNQESLLNIQETGDLRRDGSLSHTVIATWQISFEQIKGTKPAAAELLSLMTMFDRQGIPEHLLYDGRSMLEFHDAVLPLTRFSLVRTQAAEPPAQQRGEQLFEMHSLVQLSTRKWLEANRQVAKWQKASLRIMAAAFPSGQYETWAACRVLLPHARKVLSYASGNKEEVLDRATTANNTARYLLNIGEYAAAEETSRSAMKARETVLGLEDRDTLEVVDMLGVVLEKQSKYDLAAEMNRRAIDGRIKLLGDRDPLTLESLSNLAVTLEGQANYSEAEKLNRIILQKRVEIYGTEAACTIESVDNLASNLRYQSNYTEAAELFTRVLNYREKNMGKEHPGTIESLSNLAVTLERQGLYDAAVEKNQEALKRRIDVLGKAHPDTLTNMSNLASLLLKQGDIEKAEKLSEEALQAIEARLGQSNIDTLTVITTLAKVSKMRGDYQKAEALYRRSLSGFEQQLPPHHPHILRTLINLAVVLRRLKRYEEAEKLFRRAMGGLKERNELCHRDALICLTNLATVLENQGKLTEAENTNREALQGLEQTMSKDHPDTLRCLENLAGLLQAQDKYKEAEEVGRRAVDGFKARFGLESPKTLQSIAYLAHLLHRQHRHREAWDMYETACAGFKAAGIDSKASRTCLQRFATMQEEMKLSDSPFSAERGAITLKGAEDISAGQEAVSQVKETIASYPEAKRRRQSLDLDVLRDGDAAEKRPRLMTSTDTPCSKSS